jgi:hypothetical protein
VVPIGEGGSADHRRHLARPAAPDRGCDDIAWHGAHFLREIELRLEAVGIADLDATVKQSLAENQLAKLMLSFFFNAGNR